jgi:UDP-N-acetylmuramyl pentapeptide phosphotransferase/UDP-N-acetylglucosamine-1-phosphate transferase
MIYLSPLVALLVAAVSVALLLSSKMGRRIQDIPNERSLHSAPTPRIGGLGLMAGLLAGWGLLFPLLTWWLLLPLLGLVAVSLLDDIHNLPVRRRLLAQLAAAVVLVAGMGIHAREGLLLACISILFVMWLTNLYNFMDGSNGLAGGMALFGFSFYGIAAWLAHDEMFAMLCFSVSAAALGFLYFNFPMAKVFMGDAGSIPLGFLVAALGLWGWQQGCWPSWFPLLVFSPFIVDATVTLAKRAVRGAKVTEAHREHYYQRAIQMGWSHRRLALVEYALMMCCGLVALWSLEQGSSVAGLVCSGAAYALLMIALDNAWKRHTRGQHA